MTYKCYRNVTQDQIDPNYRYYTCRNSFELYFRFLDLRWSILAASENLKNRKLSKIRRLSKFWDPRRYQKKLPDVCDSQKKLCVNWTKTFGIAAKCFSAIFFRPHSSGQGGRSRKFCTEDFGGLGAKPPRNFLGIKNI